jgi:L-fuconolactonase
MKAEPRIFDVHAHLISDDPRRYPYAPLGGVVDESVLEHPLTAERMIEAMSASGVQRAIAVQRAHVYGIDNRYVVDSASRYPAHFLALVLVNPLTEDGAASVRHWVGERHAVGVRLTAPSPNCGLEWLCSSRALAVWDAVADSAASMRIHLYAWNRESGLAETFKLARRYPATSIVIDHLSNLTVRSGGPDYGLDDALKALSHCPNVSIMFSSINVLKAAGVALAPLVARLVQTFGAGRLMWGSDAGQSKPAYADMVAMARETVALLPEAERAAVLWGAACRVYGESRGST